MSKLAAGWFEPDNPPAELPGRRKVTHDEPGRRRDTVAVVFEGGAWDGEYTEVMKGVLDGRQVQRRVGVLGHDVYRCEGEWREVPPGEFKVPGAWSVARRPEAALLRHMGFRPARSER